jgi:hypothetical protein
LLDKEGEWDRFPYSDYVRGSINNKIALLIIERLCNDIIGENNEEDWIKLRDYFRQFWIDNQLYLFWAGPSGFSSNTLRINKEAKSLGIPVNEFTGKMISPKDGHTLTLEEIEQIKKEKGNK